MSLSSINPDNLSQICGAIGYIENEAGELVDSSFALFIKTRSGIYTIAIVKQAAQRLIQMTEKIYINFSSTLNKNRPVLGRLIYPTTGVESDVYLFSVYKSYITSDIPFLPTGFEFYTTRDQLLSVDNQKCVILINTLNDVPLNHPLIAIHQDDQIELIDINVGNRFGFARIPNTPHGEGVGYDPLFLDQFVPLPTSVNEGGVLLHHDHLTVLYDAINQRPIVCGYNISKSVFSQYRSNRVPLVDPLLEIGKQQYIIYRPGIVNSIYLTQLNEIYWDDGGDHLYMTTMCKLDFDQQYSSTAILLWTVLGKHLLLFAAADRGCVFAGPITTSSFWKVVVVEVENRWQILSFILLVGPDGISLHRTTIDEISKEANLRFDPLFYKYETKLYARVIQGLNEIVT